MNLSIQHSANKLHQFIDNNILASMTLSFIVGMCTAYGKIVAIEYYSIATSLTVLFLIFYRKSNLLSKYILCLLFSFCGALHLSYFNHLPTGQNHIYHCTNVKDEIVVIGTISKMISYNGKMSRIFLDSEFIRQQNTQQLKPVTGIIQLSYKGKLAKIYEPGTKVATRIKLKRPTGYIGPGVFHYPKFLAQKNIWVKGYIRSPLFIYPITYQPTFIEKIRYFPEKTRHRLGSELDRLVPNTAGLYRAILIGDKSQIDKLTLESFKACGIMHILAISGLHMAIIAGLTYGGFLFLFRLSTHLMQLYDIRKISAILTTPFLIFYSLLAGCNTPVMRSLFMSILLLSALCINRRKSPLALLSFAALTIAICSPHQLFTASFQLSFTAISAILFIFPTIQKLFYKRQTTQPILYHKLKATLVSSLLVSTVACIATLPLLLFYFNRFSIISPFTNLLIEPLICLWSLPLGLVASVLLPISAPAAELIFSFGSLGLLATKKISFQLTQLPLIQHWLPTPTFSLIAIFYFSLLIIINSHRRRIKILFGLIFTIVLALFVMPISLPFSRVKNPKVTIIDVGQGSSTLIQFSNNKNILIDCGNITFSDRSIGEQVIAPLLWKKRIKEINTIFITHGDADHYSGTPFIAKHFGVKTIVVAHRNKYSKAFSLMLEDCQLLGVQISTAKTGDIFSFQDGKILCIHNFAEDQTLLTRNEKNRGLILRAEINNSSILFPGDIDQEAEKEILDLNIDGDLLLAAHHGSKTSNSKMFLEKVSPNYLLVSSSLSKEQYFPHPQVTKQAKELNIPILSTPAHGSLEIIIGKRGYEIMGKHKRMTNPLLKANNIYLSSKENYLVTESSR